MKCIICKNDLDEHTLEQLQMCELKGKLQGGDWMESFLATLAFLGIAMVSVCGVVVLKIYNPNSNKW